MKALVVILVSILISACTHQGGRRIASVYKPIDITLDMNQAGNVDHSNIIRLKPNSESSENDPQQKYNYQDIFQYLALEDRKKTTQDHCFDFVRKFEKGGILLPERQKLIQTAEKVYDEINPRPNYPAIQFYVLVEEPKDRFDKNGRVYAAKSFLIRANHTPFKAVVNCRAFKLKDMYRLVSEAQQAYEKRLTELTSTKNHHAHH